MPGTHGPLDKWVNKNEKTSRAAANVKKMKKRPPKIDTTDYSTTQSANVTGTN